MHGVVAKLGGRAFDVLAVLVEHCHRAVGTNELMARVWPNLVVEDNTLQVHISALRKALGPGSIVTIPGRGYQLAAAAVDQPAAEMAAAATSEAAPVRSTLIARGDELWALRALVSNAPVITVVGSPGVGKTRLALEILATLPVSGRKAVLVELASLSDASLVPTAIASDCPALLRLLCVHGGPPGAAPFPRWSWRGRGPTCRLVGPPIHIASAPAFFGRASLQSVARANLDGSL